MWAYQTSDLARLNVFLEHQPKRFQQTFEIREQQNTRESIDFNN